MYEVYLWIYSEITEVVINCVFGRAEIAKTWDLDTKEKNTAKDPKCWSLMKEHRECQKHVLFELLLWNYTKFNEDIWGEMEIIDINIIIKNCQKKWQEHLERITNNWIRKLSYLNKLKCSSARDICQKGGIVSIPIIRANKQNNLWWLFSYYSSNEYKILNIQTVFFIIIVPCILIMSSFLFTNKCTFTKHIKC
jgi:hypothetical protein